jgi:hypothetical protein
MILKVATQHKAKQQQLDSVLQSTDGMGVATVSALSGAHYPLSSQALHSSPPCLLKSISTVRWSDGDEMLHLLLVYPHITVSVELGAGTRLYAQWTPGGSVWVHT